MTPDELTREIKALQEIARRWEETPGRKARLVVEVTVDALDDKGDVVVTWTREMQGIELETLPGGSIWSPWLPSVEGTPADFERELFSPDAARARVQRMIDDKKKRIAQSQAEVEEMEAKLQAAIEEVK